MEFREVYERVMIMVETGASKSTIIDFVESLYLVNKITSRMFDLLIGRIMSVCRG